MAIDDEKKFEERADYLENTQIEQWNVPNDLFIQIQKKLLGVGIKLIVGPRGTGKTHQMRLAYQKCLFDKNKPLAIYLSISKYYHLEPFLSKSSNALNIFHTWVLCKILLACYFFIDETKEKITIFEDSKLFSKENLSEFVAQAEKGLGKIEPWHDEILVGVTISKVIQTIEEMTLKTNRRRAILLFDDAALSLTHDYMIEFFDILRSLKTKSISPKASVYPGTTEYGPRFHVRQDAETVDSWLCVEDEAYSEFMDSLIKKRFNCNGDHITKKISREVIEMIKYASFGIPRTFIVLLRRYVEATSGTMQSKFNSIISEEAKLIKDEYLSLHKKMPQYKTIIETGFELFEQTLETLKKENSESDIAKQITIGIAEVKNINLSRMNRFLIEAGLFYELGTVKHGDEREYLRFIPHLIFLIKNKTFNPGRGFDPKKILKALKRISKKHPARRTFKTLIGEDRINKLVLDLPPCQTCNAQRIREEQRFCHNCGKELVSHSAFELCMKIPVEELPIPLWQKERIEEATNIKVIGDFFLLQAPQTELRKAHWIGEVKSQQIISKAKEFVEEFLA